MMTCLAAAKFSFTDPRVLWALGSLAGVLLIAALIFGLIERWRKRQENETYTAHDELTSFRALYESGELSREEFEQIRAQLLVRLKAGPAILDPLDADESREAPEPGNDPVGPSEGSGAQ